jgi:hypothetical protein
MAELTCGRLHRVTYEAELCRCIEPAGHPAEVDHRCACGQHWPRVGAAMDAMLSELDREGRLGA